MRDWAIGVASFFFGIAALRATGDAVVGMSVWAGAVIALYVLSDRP